LVDAGDYEHVKAEGLAALSPIDRTCWIEAIGSEDALPRDIDVLYLTDQANGLGTSRGILQKIELLGDRWNIVVQAGLRKDELWNRLRRSRIYLYDACPPSYALEPQAAGALCWQVGSQEGSQVAAHVTGIERPDHDAEDWIEGVKFYLEHEEERAAVAADAQSGAKKLTFDRVWKRIGEVACQQWTEIVERASSRQPMAESERALIEGWLAITLPASVEHALIARLEAASLLGDPSTLAQLKNLAGVLILKPQGVTPPSRQQLDHALECFRAAIGQDNGHIVAGRQAPRSRGLSTGNDGQDPPGWTHV
jgi:hypothetical protein